MTGALLLAGLFFGQIAVSFLLRANEARDVAALTVIAWLYLAFAAFLFLHDGRRFLALPKGT